ncbi:Hsp70 protein [Goodfellowiella coeruleoviolacea]|uniref:Hsp70 protein n=1 Tax=Goodfellowiella coeruleoviolacea TaxID=334858 RepID=A0AAE3GDF4_9PSEU|nr:Hsp70 protein [Goodfellowiella coeruleoviolacea]
MIEVDGSATMPSAVFAAEDTTIVVGRDAERRARLDPARFEPNPKRRVDEGALLLGDKVVPVTDALAAVLTRVHEETARQLGGAPLDEVRLTHPAQWGPVRRNVLLSAARLAGMGPTLTLVPEPVAAAAHFASFPDQTLAPGQALAVYDLGAGTFDVAVVGATPTGFTVLAENGLPDLGGLDVDQALLEHVGRYVSQRDPGQWQRLLRPESTADRRARRALWEDVKAAKEALSRHPQTEVPMPEPFEDVLVTRTELEALIRPSLLRSVELLTDTVRSTGMAPEHLAGIYLVGGSSRIPLVATLIGEQLGVVPTSLDQPETAVALGAHHVPQDGVSQRTQDLAAQSAPAVADAPTVITGPAVGTGPTPVATGPNPVATGPSTGGFPSAGQLGGFAATSPLPANPAFPTSGPQPAMTAGLPQYNFPTSVRPTSAPAAPASDGAAQRRLLLISVATAAVVVLAVVGGIFLFRPSSQVPSVAECQQAGDKDDRGFTSCLRQLAGAVPDKNSCQPGDSAGVSGLSDLKGVAVSCRLGDGYSVEYVHTDSVRTAEQSATAAVALNKSEVVQADWRGNGLDGRYQASADSGAGILVFTVKDRPVLGIMSKIDSGSRGRELTAGALADYFEKNVQPGT